MDTIENIDVPSMGDVRKNTRFAPLTCFGPEKPLQKTLKFRFSGPSSRVGCCFDPILVPKIVI